MNTKHTKIICPCGCNGIDIDWKNLTCRCPVTNDIYNFQADQCERIKKVKINLMGEMEEETTLKIKGKKAHD